MKANKKDVGEIISISDIAYMHTQACKDLDRPRLWSDYTFFHSVLCDEGEQSDFEVLEEMFKEELVK